MPQKYKIIQQLIDLWQEFEDQEENADFRKFGEWLSERPAEGKKNTYGEEIITTDQINIPYMEGMAIKEKINFLLSRLSRFYDFYTKKFFSSLPINNQLEFQFLLSLNKSGMPKKTEIIKSQLVEYTTGIDILKRLSRLGLVEEYKDNQDKRSIRVRITSEGKRTLIEALLRIKKINDLFFKETDIKTCRLLINPLITLNNYHTILFDKHSGKNYFEWLELAMLPE